MTLAQETQNMVAVIYIYPHALSNTIYVFDIVRMSI